MFNSLTTAWFRLIGGTPCFHVYGKGCHEKNWRIIRVFATSRRNSNSRWPAPFWRGTLITWTDSVIAMGWDAAADLLREQRENPASRDHPVTVPGGRLNPVHRPKDVDCSFPAMSEIIAHECGHTWQARWLNLFYLPTGMLFTLFREGNRWWNRFENQASEQGMFGGIVDGTVHPRLVSCLSSNKA